ncbi:hypothetical protein HDK77DRAFT_448991 [Phyllosticta capitalensis]
MTMTATGIQIPSTIFWFLSSPPRLEAAAAAVAEGEAVEDDVAVEKIVSMLLVNKPVVELSELCEVPILCTGLSVV